VNTTEDAVRFILEQEPPHRGFAFRLRENEWGLWIIVSLEELARYSQSQQEDIATWLGWLCSSVRQMKVPCYIARDEDHREESK